MPCTVVVNPIDNLRGIGKVCSRNEIVARVQYNIDIFQEVHVYEVRQIREEVDGQKTMHGNVAVLEKNVSLLPDDGLKLHLEDGRSIDFIVTGTINIANNRYEISSSGYLFWNQQID